MIEVVTFRLSGGVGPPDLVAADAAAQIGFFNLQPGMLRRTTARAEDDEWITITLWTDADAADASAAAASADPACVALSALVDGTTLTLRRYTELD